MSGGRGRGWKLSEERSRGEVRAGGSRELCPPPPAPLSQPSGAPEALGLFLQPALPPSLPPSLASLLINIEFRRCFGMEGDQRRSRPPHPTPPPTPRLGALGCCLFCPSGLIPGDTLPPATSSCLLSSVSSAWSCGGLRTGWRPRPPARHQRAGRAWGRKPSSLVWVSGRGRGSRRLSCPWHGCAPAAGCLGGCREAGPKLQRVAAWGR